MIWAKNKNCFLKKMDITIEIVLFYKKYKILLLFNK